MVVQQKDKWIGELNLLPADELEAHLNEMKELEVWVNGTTYCNIRPVRAFPFTERDKYIVLVKGEDEEIGIIQDLNDCRPEVAEVIREMLEDAYLIPKITRVYDIKVTGLVPVWDVETNRGRRRVELRRRRDVRAVGTWVLLIDADGNRYEIPDYTQLEPRSRRMVEQEV